MSRRGALRSRGLSLALRVLPWFGCDDAQEPGTSRSDAQEPGTSPSDARAGNDATRQDARPDAARRDAGSSDIATADASPRDASPRDAGSSDIATADASARDASRPDAWKPDASQRDASQPDASQPDAAPPDAAPPDAALPDAALPDAALPDAGPAPIEWAACPLHSDVAGDEAECATVRRPLQTGVPGSPSIDVWVKRVRNGEDLGQIWLLQGGPGASVTDFDTRLRDFQARTGGLDVYQIEHRGVGASTRLGCPIQESPDSEAQGTVSPGELPGCVAALVDTWAEPGLEALLRELRRGTAHDMP